MAVQPSDTEAPATPPVKGGRKPIREARRERILEGLFEAVAKNGMRGASITEIADAAGITRGALHYFFESKEEILAALMRRLGARYLDGLRGYLERSIDRGADPLRAIVKFHLSGDELEAERLLGVWIDFWGNAPSQASIHEAVFDVQEGARHLCVRALEVARPDLDPTVDRRAAAAALLSIVEGGILQWRVAVRSRAPLARDQLAQALGDAAVAYARSLPGDAR